MTLRRIVLLWLFAHLAVAQQTVPDNIEVPQAPEQPIPFSHKQHLTSGLLCANCHSNPGQGAAMGFPSDASCMICHAAVAADSESIQKLKSHIDRGDAISWKRVYQIAEGISWSHKVHIDAGLQCETCHGDVRNLDVMAQVTAVTAMATCITCHQAHETGSDCKTCHAWPPEDLLGKD